MIALTVMLVTACGSPPKTAAGFCKVYHQQEAEYLRKYEASADSDLGDLVQLISAVSDLVPMFEKLDQAAPPSIEADVKNIVDSLRQQEQAAGQEVTDPLGGLASGLVTGMMSTASWENVGDFINKHSTTGNS